MTNSLGMKLALIPAGEFLMGSPGAAGSTANGEEMQHRVRITRPFYLGANEVTRGQFRRFVHEAGYRTEAERDGKGGLSWNEGAGRYEQDPKYTWQNPGFEQTDEHPVVNVTWNDAVAFCAWLSRKEGVTYRLPTEAEWEYACRAGTTTRYSCGDDPEGLAAVGNIADGTLKARYPDWKFATIAARDGHIYTAPVGRYKPNAWGLFDMHGNVSEWCADGFAADYYKRSPVDDPPGPDGSPFRMIRGGGWDTEPGLARLANRPRFVPGYRTCGLGFRVTLALSGRALPSAPPTPDQPPREAPIENRRPARPRARKPVSDALMTNSLGIKLALIPAGEFLIGSPEPEGHLVRITRPFCLGVTEVTPGQFRRFIDDAGYRTEAERDGKGGWGWNGAYLRLAI
jgi:formylglycine-generating enzyme required for sulfatase activity